MHWCDHSHPPSLIPCTNILHQSFGKTAWRCLFRSRPLHTSSVLDCQWHALLSSSLFAFFFAALHGVFLGVMIDDWKTEQLAQYHLGLGQPSKIVGVSIFDFSMHRFSGSFYFIHLMFLPRNWNQGRFPPPPSMEFTPWHLSMGQAWWICLDIFSLNFLLFIPTLRVSPHQTC